jgi:hypothetical protein
LCKNNYTSTLHFYDSHRVSNYLQFVDDIAQNDQEIAWLKNEWLDRLLSAGLGGRARDGSGETIDFDENADHHFEALFGVCGTGA